jgi:acyl-CoA synthetase (AMP-forming)/AMP-acid ligase II
VSAPIVFRSPLSDVEIPDVPLTELVLGKASALRDKPALIDAPTGRVLTYGELDAGVRRLAGGLVARGFRKGEVLALMAPNMPEYAVVFHGTAMAGGIVTTVNPSYTEREVHHQLLDAGATILVTTAHLIQTVRAAIVGTAVTEVVLLGDEPLTGTTPFATLLGTELATHVPVDGSDIVAMPYSSGTTGLSKGVMLTHRNLVANALQMSVPAEFHENEVFDAVLPFFHIYGMQIMMNCGLAVGATVVILPRFDLEQYLRMHQRYGVTRSFVAPPIVVQLAKHPMVDSFDLSALRFVMCAAAPLSAELAQEAAGRLDVEVLQSYGMTELSPVASLTPAGQLKPGSVGVAAPNTEFMIVDPVTGTSVGIHLAGEVCVRGPQVMAGYLNNATATAATIDTSGWLHTGDVGTIDDDGHLHIVDRLKELIKYKGFQVPPAELEALLLTHPSVADAAVIGASDDDAGEVPVGFVVLKPDHEVSDIEVMRFVAERVASYKQIRRITFVATIPKSPSGKILRRQLRG